MLTEEINREISAWCGESYFVGLMRRGFWYRPNGHGYTGIESEAWHLSPEEAKRHENLRDDQPVTIEKFTPRKYTECLNACHEAEKRLNEDQWKDYSIILNRISCRIICHNVKTCGYTIAATALQRCEALLRTIGKWKD